MNYHFIAIGGSAMHNLAIALHKQGDTVTGSEDEIFEPSRSRLAKYGLLPAEQGWFPGKIHSGIDAVVLGMHAKADNPELLEAGKLGITIYSYPEFLYNQTKDKTRVVIGGSHGKTTTTAMVMHVLKENSIEFDYMVGAQLAGFDTMVHFSKKSKIAVFEGDEYLTSPIDLRPKFHLYKPHIGLITGIAWDHINVFPTFENYISQFTKFVGLIEDGGTLVYFEPDPELQKISSTGSRSLTMVPYSTHPHTIMDDTTHLSTKDGNVEIAFFGEHNLQNVMGAYHVCRSLGLTERQFYSAIKTFGGASKRLQLLKKSPKLSIYQDFAHSPSKLKATIEAVKRQFPNRKLIACMELHTYSSLNKSFLVQYQGSMELADMAYVFYSNHAIQLKRLEPLSPKMVEEAFAKPGLKVFTSSGELTNQLFSMSMDDSVLLWLSSGNFDGLNLVGISEELANKNSH